MLFFGTSEVRALCPTDEPISTSEAEGDNVYVVLCGLQNPGGGDPLPCPAPDYAPTLVPGSAQAQGAVLSAQVPTDLDPAIGNAYAVWWIAEHVSAAGDWQTLWKHRSVQGIGPSGTGRHSAP